MYNNKTYTVIETPAFQKQVAKIWSQDECYAFIDWIAVNPLAGDVVSGADGARKVRWAVAGKGKRGGARVIYFNLSASELVLLVAVYVKGDQANLPAHNIPKE